MFVYIADTSWDAYASRVNSIATQVILFLQCNISDVLNLVKIYHIKKTKSMFMS